MWDLFLTVYVMISYHLGIAVSVCGVGSNISNPLCKISFYVRFFPFVHVHSYIARCILLYFLLRESMLLF